MTFLVPFAFLSRRLWALSKNTGRCWYHVTHLYLRYLMRSWNIFCSNVAFFQFCDVLPQAIIHKEIYPCFATIDRQCQHYWEGCHLRSKRGARVLEEQYAPPLFDCAPCPSPRPQWAQNSQSCDSGDELTMAEYSFTCPLVVLYCCNCVLIHTLLSVGLCLPKGKDIVFRFIKGFWSQTGLFL